jgi:hypothetical protein
MQVLFVSPILDMELVIQNMMKWAGITKEQLKRDKFTMWNLTIKYKVVNIEKKI